MANTTINELGNLNNRDNTLRPNLERNIRETYTIGILTYTIGILRRRESRHHEPRTCYQCGRTITCKEALETSLNRSVSPEQIEAVWNDPLFEFLCCACYRHETKMPVHGLVTGIRIEESEGNDDGWLAAENANIVPEDQHAF